MRKCVVLAVILAVGGGRAAEVRYADGGLAVALLNRSPLSREIRVTFDELGLRGAHFLRDCWTGRCEGKHAGYYAATVLPHATKLIRIKANECPKCD